MGLFFLRKNLQAIQVVLWSVWLSGFLLIGLSLYATQIKDHINNPKFNHNMDTSKITIFTGPSPFTGSVGARQSLAIRSWLALSSQVTVVLFSRHPSVVSFAEAYGSRVLVDPNIDFTFLGTPFFHSMVARSQEFMSDISVLINPETIVLPDLISTLGYTRQLNRDWLLFALSQNLSDFPFYLDESSQQWLNMDGEKMNIQQLQEMLNETWQRSCCEGRMLMAWNSADLPLHNGVLPPFLFQKGLHYQWIINEALSCDKRFVFDASRTVSSFFLNVHDHQSSWSFRGPNASLFERRSWEYVGNSHLAALYGSLFFHENKFSSLVRLTKCGENYLFGNTTENVHHYIYQKFSSRKKRILNSWRFKKHLACIDDAKTVNRISDCFIEDKLKPFTPLNFPLPLESLLPLVADKNRTIVLAVAGYSYKDMLMSWACRLRQLAVTNYVICALDEETYQFSILQGLPVFRDPLSPSNISFNDCHFGTKCFQRVTKVKSRIVLKILKLGYNVLLSDVDVYWFRNPLSFLCSFGPAVLAAQSDEYNQTGPINLPRRLNSGFYFARSNSPTILSMEKVVKHAASSGLSEQPSFYDTLCGEGGSQRVGDNKCVEQETNLTVHFLDRNLFPNGAYLGLWQKNNVKAACVKKGCFVLHNNWISGRVKKLERQVSSGLWDYDISTRMCLQR